MAGPHDRKGRTYTCKRCGRTYGGGRCPCRRGLSGQRSRSSGGGGRVGRRGFRASDVLYVHMDQSYYADLAAGVEPAGVIEVASLTAGDDHEDELRITSTL